MKTLRLYTLPLLALIALVSSCSVKKRHYRPGYHVEWASAKPARAAESKKERTVVPVRQESTRGEASVVLPVQETPADVLVSAEKTLPVPFKKLMRPLNRAVVFAGGTGKHNAFEKSHADTGVQLDSPYTRNEPAEQFSILSIIGFSCGLLAFLLSIVPQLALVGLLMAIAAIVLSALGLGETNKGKKGKGFAIAGLILGILFVFIILLALLVLIAILGAL